MKRYILAFASIFTLLAAQAQVPKEKTLLWKITGKDLQQPSYLYGTFHALCPEDYNMAGTVKSAFHTTKQLYLEIDMDDPQMMTKMMKGIFMKDGHDLKEYLSVKDFDSVANIFKAATKMPLTMFTKYKPYMLMSFLYPSLLGCTPVVFEKEFEKLAKADSIEVKGLETIEDQLQVFDDIPYKAQAKMLKNGLYNLEESKEELKTLVVQYKTKDIDKMYSDISGHHELGKYEKLLLQKRNENWISRIGNAAATMPTFFAVGAGHLGGKTGVIHLLRKAGYTVEPIMY